MIDSYLDTVVDNLLLAVEREPAVLALIVKLAPHRMAALHVHCQVALTTKRLAAYVTRVGDL